MSPRQYRMGARAESVERTRQAIVAAARKLHAQRGLVATGWDDIAELARVSVATVYRHFPSLAELVPACARTVFDLIQPLTIEQAGATFGSLELASDRFEQLVRYSCHCYEAGADWLHAAYRERDFVAELDEALQVIEDSLDALVVAAARRTLTEADHSLLVVLCNFPLWFELVEAGVTPAMAEDTLVRLVRAEVGRIGLDTTEPQTRQRRTGAKR